MDDDIVMLKPGDRCPLCGQPIETDDEDALLALTLMREYLDIAEVAGAAISRMRRAWDETPQNGEAET